MNAVVFPRFEAETRVPRPVILVADSVRCRALRADQLLRCVVLKHHATAVDRIAEDIVGERIEERNGSRASVGPKMDPLTNGELVATRMSYGRARRNATCLPST